MTTASSPGTAAGPATPEGPRPYVATDVDGHETLAPRQCGRCRQLFEGDPTLPPAALQEWWACPPCRLALLGR
jgi:hypothetical protein